MASALAACGLVAPAAMVMLRAERGVKIPLPWPGFAVYDERSYGTTTLHLMVLAARTEPLPPPHSTATLRPRQRRGGVT